MSNNLFTKFQSTLFQSKDVFFSYYFKQYIVNNVHYIHHTEIMNEWKSSMYKASYEVNLKNRVKLPPERSILDSQDVEKVWPKHS